MAPALDLAARYDRKLVVEQGVGGQALKARELEVAVLGNDAPQASVAGEIIPGKEFYDYEAKYLSEGSKLVIPAKLSKADTKRVREMAVAAFRACDLCGLARVDFLMEPGGKRRIYLNEVNTMPGLHQHQHVSQAVAGLRPQLQEPDHAPDRAGHGAPCRKEPHHLQPGKLDSGQWSVAG